jgi:RNA polymerase sigma-19 factor, ECF subfamily
MFFEIFRQRRAFHDRGGLRRLKKGPWCPGHVKKGAFLCSGGEKHSGLSWKTTLSLMKPSAFKGGMTDPSTRPGTARTALTAEAFRHYAVDLHRYLRKRLRDPQKADDVVQEVFSRLLRVQQLELIRKPHSYLFGIAFHVIREMRLQEEQEPVSYDSVAVEAAAEHPTHVSQDEIADRLNVRAQLERALARLPDIHRALVLMCKRDGMTYEEAAAATGISVHMVEKHMIQARVKLLSMMWDL